MEWALHLRNFIIPRSLINNNVFQFVLPQLGNQNELVKKVNLRQLGVNDSSIPYRVGSYSSSQRRKQSSLSFKDKSHNNHRETNNEGFCTDLSMRDKIGWFNFYY